MTTEYLGVTDVAKRLGISTAAVSAYKLPEPDATIGRTRGWLPDTIDRWNASRPGRASAEDAHARTRPNNKKSPSPSLG